MKRGFSAFGRIKLSDRAKSHDVAGTKRDFRLKLTTDLISRI